MAKLALMGGPKAVTLDRKQFAPQPVSEEAIAAVVALMRKGETSTSPSVAAFESEFAEYVGTKFALAVTSGSAALHSALFAAGIGPGDEVIVPSYTYGSTAAIIATAGGTAVFCDVDRETMNTDPADVARKITPRTRAFMLCHVWGNPCDMGPLLELARSRGITVIEDCSHAHGATWQGKRVGAIGDVGCFSCQGSKLVAAGEGGVLTTNNRVMYERAILLGRIEKRAEFQEDPMCQRYSLVALGIKYRPHPLAIAIARDQLHHLDEMNEIRDRQGAALESGLADIPAIAPQRVVPGARRVYAYHYMRYDPAHLGDVSLGTFLRALAAEGVSAGRNGYGRLHGEPLFLGGFPFSPGRTTYGVFGVALPPFANGPLPVTDEIRVNTFQGAPRFETECPELIAQYVEAYHKVAGSVDELRTFDREHAGKAPAPQVSTRSINPV
ncbi:MAG: DegT/DnrJ/EryC1/StrS family aminotransferase [Armatimonadetes bacterium]|nr:DegT/DnrJ/EryC1/StrS family aminotransferase [Armatimonadota bacterium]